MLPRQGEMGENIPFTRTVGKRSLNYLGTLGTLERVTTLGNHFSAICLSFYTILQHQRPQSASTLHFALFGPMNAKRSIQCLIFDVSQKCFYHGLRSSTQVQELLQSTSGCSAKHWWLYSLPQTFFNFKGFLSLKSLGNTDKDKLQKATKQYI